MKTTFFLSLLLALSTSPVMAEQNVILDLYWTPEGAHSPAPFCTTGYQAVGGAADCGGGRCYGNQLLCARIMPLAQVAFNQSIVMEFWMTPEGTHQVSGHACPHGFTVRGSVADCGHGRCYGNQILCVRTVAEYLILPWEDGLKGVWVTPPGSHLVGGGSCPAGYKLKNSVADCGHAVCNGNQLVCAAMGPLY